MAGLMWRRCVALLMFSAWQACHAGKLVNVVEPYLTQYAPTGGTQFWSLFDRDTSTYLLTRRVYYRTPQHYELPRATTYRITMAAHVAPPDYPSSWKIEESDKYGNRITHEVTDAEFHDGVYEGPLKQKKKNSVHIIFEEKVTVAEVELLGPRSALDILWPYGNYPCRQRHEVITEKRGPKKIFSRSKYATTYKDLRQVFSAQRSRSYTRFHFDGDKPVILGAELPELPMVHEVVLQGGEFCDWVEKVVVQGSLCESRADGRCDKFASEGWVRLGVRRVSCYEHTRIYVANPDKYKAYRLKFVPFTGDRRHPNGDQFYIGGVYFLGCTA